MLFQTYFNNSKKYIFLRISNKCSCNCVSCDLPKVKRNQYISLVLLDDILSFIGENFGNGFELNFIGYHLFGHPELNKILSISKYFKISLHVDYNDIISHLNIIKNHSNIQFTIQKNIYSPSDFKKLLVILEFIRINAIDNLEIDILFSFNERKNFLHYFLSKYDIKVTNNNVVSFNIGGSKISIENIYSEEFTNKCNYVESYLCENGTIFIKDNIEFCLLTGNIKTHLSSYCNLGIISLGNIHNENLEIYNNFKNTKIVLKKNEQKGAKRKCIDCIKNPIKL